MSAFKKTVWVSTAVACIILFDFTSKASAEITRTVTQIHTEYIIKDELFANYSIFDIREMARRVKERARSLRENAMKHFNSLLPMQGKSRAIIAQAREQALKLRDQQRMRNRINDDRLADQRHRQRELAFQRRDVKLKIRQDR